MRSGLVFRGQRRRHSKGARSQPSPFFRVPFYLCVHPLSQNYQLRHGNTWGRGLYLEVSHAPISRDLSSRAPQCWGSPVFMPTPFKTERPNSAWYRMGRGMFYEVSHAIILHKCVARLSARAEFLVCTTEKKYSWRSLNLFLCSVRN